MTIITSRLPSPPSTLPFALAERGDAVIAERLAAALRSQWAWGFPTVPKPAPQLTHGFYQYPAGMQPVAAAHLLSTLPEGRLLDPFVGGGTTLVEALRGGWDVVGCDASPLALFASAHHTWLPDDTQLEALREQSTMVIKAVDQNFDMPTFSPLGAQSDATPQARNAKLARQAKLDGGRRRDATTLASWEPLRMALEDLVAREDTALVARTDRPAEPSPLWFCYAAAQQRAERYRLVDPLSAFAATVGAFCTAARELRAHVPASTLSVRSPVTLLHSDARHFSLKAAELAPADAVVTSPPCESLHATTATAHAAPTAAHHNALTTTLTAMLTAALTAAHHIADHIAAPHCFTALPHHIAAPCTVGTLHRLSQLHIVSMAASRLMQH